MLAGRSIQLNCANGWCHPVMLRGKHYRVLPRSKTAIDDFVVSLVWNDDLPRLAVDCQLKGIVIRILTVIARHKVDNNRIDTTLRHVDPVEHHRGVTTLTWLRQRHMEGCAWARRSMGSLRGGSSGRVTNAIIYLAD